MKLWNGEYYDYHGQCDLVFVEAPEFGNGVGLTIHLRTTIRYDYSYVDTAAVKIGDDVLEVTSWGDYSFNDVERAHMPKKMGPNWVVEYEKLDEKKHKFFIQLQHQDEYIELVTFKDWVSIKINGAREHNFGTSKGLM